MSEDQKDNNNAIVDDVVKKEDYNKLVESHNTMKLENEKIAKELAETKQTEKDNQEKTVWQKELEETKKQMEDLKKQIEIKNDDKTVAKGIVTPPIQKNLNQGDTKSEAQVKELLDKEFPDRKATPENFGSNIARYDHYRDPRTKSFTDMQFGKILSLHAGAQNVDPSLIPSAAKQGRDDIVLVRN